MDKQVPLQAWPGEDESIHGCRTNTTHYTTLALLVPAFLWGFCELPAPCMASTHHGVQQPGAHPGILEKQDVRGSASLYSSCYQTGGHWTHMTHHSTPLCIPSVCPCHSWVSSVFPMVLEHVALPGGVSVAAEQDRGELSLGTLIRQWGRGGGGRTTPKTSLVMSNLPGGAEGASWSCSSPSGNNTQSIPSPCSSSPGDFFPLVKVQTNKLHEVFSSNPPLQG